MNYDNPNDINIENINIENNINNEYLLPFFENIQQQNDFICREQQLYNSITIEPNKPLSYEDQYFLVNQDYNKYWEWALRIDLELYINPFDVVDLDYIYENLTIENNQQIINMIDNGVNVDELVNILKTLSIKSKMQVYQIGFYRNPPLH